MKLIVSLILVLGLALASDQFQVVEHDSHPDSPFALLVKGFFDVIEQKQNKLDAYIRVVNELIPITNILSFSSANKENPLHNLFSYGTTKCFGTDGLNVCVSISTQFLIGWKVIQNGVTEGLYNVTFMPYSNGWLRSGVSLDFAAG